MSWKGSFASLLDIALGNADMLATDETRFLLAELIAAILLTIPLKDLAESGKFEKTEHTHSFLLALLAMNRIRETLKATLLVEPPFIQLDCVSSYHKFNNHIKSTFPSKNCCSHTCDACGGRQDCDILVSESDSSRSGWDVR
jgi:hypothetical protein